MKEPIISIIIVNYNVKHFLYQCLTSVKEAVRNIDSEIWVVDNNSVDGSVEMIKEKFPDVKLIENKKNLGFAKANNQAIAQSKGKYILLLNPDTVIKEDTLEIVIDFMEKNSNAGAVGVRMVDGQGRFLRESKRGLPKPWASFFKMIGLTKIFPKSKIFSYYYLGHLDDNQIQKVEVLSGAFMCIRKSVLDEIGYLDESFFMYGEDIDLSYRILKAKYDLYYIPTTTIIHYKGESTKKSSLNYVFTFYNAMLIFVKKHYGSKQAIFRWALSFGVIFSAFISALKRFVGTIFLPVLDFLAIFFSYKILIPFWIHYFKHDSVIYDSKIWYLIAVYALIWLFFGYIFGIYDKPFKPIRLYISQILGTIFILVLYALLPLYLRYSRGLIILGFITSTGILLSVRYLLHVFRKYTNFEFYSEIPKKVIFLGLSSNIKLIENILKNSNINVNFSPINLDSENISVELLVEKFEELKRIYSPHTIILDANVIRNEHIIEIIRHLSNTDIDIKIFPKDSETIISSNYILSVEDLVFVNKIAINSPVNRRLKRLVDILASLVFIILLWYLIWVVNKKMNFIKNIFLVLFGKKTWVGIKDAYLNKNNSYLSNCVLTPIDLFNNLSNDDSKFVVDMNLNYAKNYTPITDIAIILNSIKKLGN